MQLPRSSRSQRFPSKEWFSYFSCQVCSIRLPSKHWALSYLTLPMTSPISVLVTAVGDWRSLGEELWEQQRFVWPPLVTTAPATTSSDRAQRSTWLSHNFGIDPTQCWEVRRVRAAAGSVLQADLPGADLSSTVSFWRVLQGEWNITQRFLFQAVVRNGRRITGPCFQDSEGWICPH